jgi:TonB-dependent SusC/RagA subfamily outer membrane receptor
MRGKLSLLFILLCLNVGAQYNRNMVRCGIPIIKKEDLILSDTLKKATITEVLSGNKGAEPVIIRLRCRSSIMPGNEPLYVVDGVVSDSSLFSKLSVNTIENISVLKNPAATAIYGYRAQHGVIVIITKQANNKIISVKDAGDSSGINAATITATSRKTGKSFRFTTDEYGRIATDSLRASDYRITVSCIGYKTKQRFLNPVKGNQYEIYLEKEFKELNEVVVTGLSTITRKSITSKCYSSRLVCTGHGVKLTNEKQIQLNYGVLAPSAVKLYPNPVARLGTINLSFVDTKPGQYQIRLMNAAGQLVYNIQKQISSSGETEQIHLTSDIVAGIYFLQIINEQMKLEKSSRVIIQ